MDRHYSMSIAQATDRPISEVRQRLRALREAGLVPGADQRPRAVHAARIALALATDNTTDAPALVSKLRTLPLQTPCSLPATAEGMLTRLIETVPRSPVLDDFDIDDGFVHVGDDSVSLECLTLAGHRVVVRYGEPFSGISHRVTILMTTIQKIAKAIEAQHHAANKN
jgi:hypothetical protein